MGKPIVKAISRPKQMHVWVSAPAGPLISRGEVSSMYLGQKTEKDPIEIPYMNLPRQRQMKDGKREMITPITRIKLESIIHFHLPREAILPEKRAPMAHPPVIRA